MERATAVGGITRVFKLSRKGQFFEERRVCPPQMRVTSGMSTPKGRGQRFVSVPAGCALYLPTDRLKADLGGRLKVYSYFYAARCEW